MAFWKGGGYRAIAICNNGTLTQKEKQSWEMGGARIIFYSGGDKKVAKQEEQNSQKVKNIKTAQSSAFCPG